MHPKGSRFWRWFYDQAAFACDAILDLGERTGIGSEGLIRRKFVSRLPFVAGDSILDVGCGTGALRAYLPSGVRYIGVDLSRGMLLRAKRKNNPTEPAINLVQADAQRLPFKSALANTTIAMGVLQHLSLPSLALRELRRVAAAGGRVLVIDENRAKLRVFAGLRHDNVTLLSAGEYFIYQA